MNVIFVVSGYKCPENSADEFIGGGLSATKEAPETNTMFSNILLLRSLWSIVI